MRLLALVPYLYDTAPGQRFRFEQWEPLLRQHGVEITFVPFECQSLHSVLHKPGHINHKVRLIARALTRRVRLLRSVRAFDVVLIQREAALVGPPFIEKAIQRSGVPLVFDFDDAIFMAATSAANKYMGWLKFHAKTREICRMASHVIAGNEYLADYAREVNDRVTVVPTTIDTDKYQIDSNPPVADPPVIGWSGSFTTVQYLDALRGVLVRLAQQERFHLRVIGASSYALNGIRVEAIPWRSATEVADLRTLDIGVMPLPDDEWARGKCGLKALQYMALGIPTICSPVGVNSTIIHDGENGFLATTEDEWVDRLLQLLRSASLREQLGRAGRATVEATYSASVQAPRVLNILESVISSSRGALRVQ